MRRLAIVPVLLALAALSVAPAQAATVPPVSKAAKAAGLVDIRSVVPDALIDLRYATSQNFTHTRLYPKNARCLVHKSMAAGLQTAANHLRKQGYLLVFWDCYRPHAVQIRMYKIVSDPNWVAKPGPYARSHEAARSVDVSLAHRSLQVHCPKAYQVHKHCRLDLGTGFDNFTAKAHAYATQGVRARAVTNRVTLRNAMAAGGITVYSGEWWHFDGPGALSPRPVLHVPVN